MQPYAFIAGKPVGQRKAKKADGGGGNAAFSGQNGPKPPPALSTAVLGMKKGGKVRLPPPDPCPPAPPLRVLKLPLVPPTRLHCHSLRAAMHVHSDGPEAPLNSCTACTACCPHRTRPLYWRMLRGFLGAGRLAPPTCTPLHWH